jgi:hypothetical protein
MRRLALNAARSDTTEGWLAGKCASQLTRINDKSRHRHILQATRGPPRAIRAKRFGNGASNMTIWCLRPRDLSDPNWEASSHRAAVIVRAPDEKAAREVAEAAFGVKTRFRPGAGIIAPPWKRAELVIAERITDERFQADGPSMVLSPSFESDLRGKESKI